jgi:ATP-dependent Clp protease ATP-binding subunit ClpX
VSFGPKNGASTKLSMNARNAYCSFCRKSYTDVGPLVEGPDNVYICAACTELCQSIIEQERRRRDPSPPSAKPTAVRAKLDQVVRSHEEVKQALVQATCRSDGMRPVLLIGPSRSTNIFLARAIAHALEVPFAAGDLSGFVKSKDGSEDAFPLLYSLLYACDFDVEAAQHGVVYLEGVDQPKTQEASLHLWEGRVSERVTRLGLDLRGVFFVCGGAFDGLDEAIVRAGRHREQPLTADALVAAGVSQPWVRHLAAIARAAPLDDEALTGIMAWIDFSRVERGLAAALAQAQMKQGREQGA